MIPNKVLLVDDDTNILELYRLELGNEFDIVTSDRGDSALDLLNRQGPFAVIVADMHMPGMNGMELLRRVCSASPATVRIMLTGDEHQKAAIDAVNEGQIFRFIRKPCAAQQLARVIRAALEQFQLVTAEKQLLDETLNGTIKLLVEVLSLVSPIAFGRATRVKRLVSRLCDEIGVANSWELSVAAMLSQLGCVAIPEVIMEKIQRREPLNGPEMQLYASHPRIAHDLLSRIPRLDRVAQIIALQQTHTDSHTPHDDSTAHQDIFRTARLLAIALEFDQLVETGHSPALALQAMKDRSIQLDAPWLHALSRIVEQEYTQGVVAVTVDELRPGMILNDDIVDLTGRVLVTKSQELSTWVIDRLRRRVHLDHPIRQPIRVTRLPSARPSRVSSRRQLTAVRH